MPETSAVSVVSGIRVYYSAIIADNRSMTAFKKAKTGRPQKLTPQISADICNALRAGAYIETASALAGISKDSLYEWLKIGKKAKDGPYKEFSDAVTKSMAEAEMRDLLNIDKAAMGLETIYETYEEGTIRLDEYGAKIDVSGTIMTDSRGRPIVKRMGFDPDWSASAWRLERKYPKKWAKTEKTMELEDHDDEKGGAIVVNFVKAKK